MDEVDADLEDHVQRTGTEGKRTSPRQYKENQRGGRRAQDSVANRFDDTPVMAFDVAH